MKKLHFFQTLNLRASSKIHLPSCIYPVFDGADLATRSCLLRMICIWTPLYSLWFAELNPRDPAMAGATTDMWRPGYSHFSSERSASTVPATTLNHNGKQYWSERNHTACQRPKADTNSHLTNGTPRGDEAFRISVS